MSRAAEDYDTVLKEKEESKNSMDGSFVIGLWRARNGVIANSKTSPHSGDAETVRRYKLYLQAPLTAVDLFDNPQSHVGKTVRLNGYLGKRKDLSRNLSFFELLRDPAGQTIQIVSHAEDANGTHEALKSIRSQSAITMVAEVVRKRLPYPEKLEEPVGTEAIELRPQEVTSLSVFPADIIASENAQYRPEERHLQMRFNPIIRERLRFRDAILRAARAALQDFVEIETPTLFKSTPEGAREFLVPTRRPGFAYALPQSPQQYKQLLMAAGFRKYFQVARCYRDEDLRADRQPEFTQLDLEMSFFDGQLVMDRIEKFFVDMFQNLGGWLSNTPAGGLLTKVHLETPSVPFLKMTYEDAMRMYGTDKPDLRISGSIQQFTDIVSRDLTRMLSNLENPCIEGFRLRLTANARKARNFVTSFMDSAKALAFIQNTHGSPGIFIYDPSKPLQGLHAFGHEGAESVEALFSQHHHEVAAFGVDSGNAEEDGLAEGDIIVLQARPQAPTSGNSTTLGKLRVALYHAAVDHGLVDHDASLRFLWVTDFPMFTPDDDTEPGQEGSAGFSATHHPFTAPKSPKDVDLMFSEPLRAKADHYDLVVNGVELGGGSRRIHDSEMQQSIMRNVLRMKDDRLLDFSHLFEALRAGCPPHAGIALGVDRLVAVLLGLDSIRDVIAFPKNGKGEDPMVGSPTRMTDHQQQIYNIAVLDSPK